MTSWYWEPGEDFAKYEREDALTPDQMMQELEDNLERPYGSSAYGGWYPPRKTGERTPAEAYEELHGPYVCTRCKTQIKDDACPMCGGSHFRRLSFVLRDEERGAA